MLFAFNPKSGRGELAPQLFEVIDLFTRAGYSVTAYPTAAPGDARSFIIEHGGGFDIVVCSGGDGMVFEAVNAYMRMDSPPPPFAYMPSGTTNDFAASLGLPRGIMEAAHAILDGRPHQIDVGVFGNEYFSYVAAFGLFTNVPYTTDQNAKNILGPLAYFLEGVKRLASIPSIGCRLEIDGERVEGNLMLGVISNGASVAGFQSLFETAPSLNDGLFETLFVFKPENFADHQELIGMLMGFQEESGLVVRRTANRVLFSSDLPCEWTLDGEYGGYQTDVIIENRRCAFSIIN
jgi:YegS/Rv2252/BmrU family lipid kinase